MKSLFIILFTTLVILACQHRQPEVAPNTEAEDSVWVKLEIPNAREAHAVVGNIDTILLVTTYRYAYYTTDKGKTWQESKNFQGHISGLLVRNDTIFALAASSGKYMEVQAMAGVALYYTTDFGKNWRHCSIPDYRQPIGLVQSESGITYRLKHKISNSYFNPTEISKENASGPLNFYFPFKHIVNNLYLDSSERLYVVSSGSIYQEASNTFYCCPENTPAVIYISRKPLP